MTVIQLKHLEKTHDLKIVSISLKKKKENFLKHTQIPNWKLEFKI